MMNLHDEIAVVAYELYDTRGCIHGWDLDDWLAAERIVLGQHAGQEMEEPEAVDVLEEIADMEKEKLEEASVVKEIKGRGPYGKGS
jgi:hypothetical protein